MCRRNCNKFFSKLAQQHEKDVAALFYYFGIKAPVNCCNIKNAIRVFKKPFSEKLAAIVNEESSLNEFNFDGKLSGFFAVMQKQLEENKKAAEEKEKEKEKILGMSKGIFFSVLFIILLIVILVFIKVLKRK